MTKIGTLTSQIVTGNCSECRTDTLLVSFDENIYRCESCENYSCFNEVRVPYAMKLFIQELESMSIAPRLIV